MEPALVIARAYAGKPLKAVIIEDSERVFYISAPERVAALNRGDTEAVGFPKNDIFVFNSDTYEKLRAQWDAHGRTEPSLWLELVRYKS